MRRERQLKVMVSEAEHRQLHKLAKLDGVSASDIVRGLIRSAFKASKSRKR